MKGRKLEFRQKSNGQLVDHYDEASNIEYKNAGSGLAAGNVQEAISELAARPSGNGGTIISSGAYVRLEDFPGFDESFIAPLPEYVDLRSNDMIEEYIYGVFPVDYEETFENMALNDYPDDWNTAQSTYEDNPRNWYFGKYVGRCAKVPGVGGHDAVLCDLWTNCIRAGKEDKWFVTYNEALTALNALDVEQGTYTIYVAKRTYNGFTGRFNRFQNPVNIEDSNLTENDLEKTNIERVEEFQEEWLTANAALLERAKNTRDFIQTVLDNCGPDDIILFPYNKEIVVGFYYNVRQYGRKSNPGYDYYAPENRYKQYNNTFYIYSLFIYHKVNIDLNGCTLSIVPNWHRGYGLISILSENILDVNPVNNFADMPGGGYISNGTIKGDWDVHVRLPVEAALNTSVSNFSVEFEHCSGISCKDVITVKNLKVYNFPGDGISFDSPKEGITNIIYMTTRGKLKDGGSLGEIQNDENGSPTGWWYTNLENIASRRSYPDRIPIIRPVYPTEKQQNDYFSNCELAPYYIDEEFAVAYYNNTNTCIKVERPCFGDALNIPYNATQFRFFIHIDPEIEAYNSTIDNNPARINIMFLEVDWKNHSIVEGCEIFNCGRNGITPTAMKNGVIRNCNFYNEDSKVQAIVDIEGVAGIDSGNTMEECWLHGSNASITSPTGDNFYIVRCKLRQLNCSQPHLHVEDCDATHINARVKYFNNIVKPRRVILNSQVREVLNVSYSLVSNCRVRGYLDNSQKYSAESKYPNVFENTVFRVYVLTPGVYKNCYINLDFSLLSNANRQYVGCDSYYYEKYINLKDNKYVFENCRIEGKTLKGIWRLKYDVSDYNGNIVEVSKYSKLPGETDNQNELPVDGQLYYDKNNRFYYLYTDGAYQQYGTPIYPILSFKNCEIILDDTYTQTGLEDSGAHFLNTYIESFIDNVVTVKVKNDVPAIRFVPYGKCVISGNEFKVSNSVTNFKALLLKFYKTTMTNAYNVRVENNIFEYAGNTSNVGIVIAETDMYYKPDTDVNVVLNNNIFYKKGSGTAITPYSVGSMTAAGCSFTVDADNNMAVNGGTLNVQNNG